MLDSITILEYSRLSEKRPQNTEHSSAEQILLEQYTAYGTTKTHLY